MDTITRNNIIDSALGKGRHTGMQEKLRKLLNERQIPFLLPTNNMEVRRSIDSGNFGIVELVRYQKKLYAHKRPIVDIPERRESILEEAIRLADIAEYHPNIQQLYFINLKSFGFLMDYCDCGSLHKVVINQTPAYMLVDVFNWGYQLADALSFLHSQKIMHRDVKIQNILLKENYQTLVLTDYGTATQLGRSLLTNNVGTPITMAPEVFSGTKYGEQCDIYAWSIVFWQLLSRQLSPYDNKNITSFGLLMKISTENLRPYKLKNCPDLFVALMYRSWHSDSNERPTLSFIKTLLRLLLNLLPKSKHECSEEMVNEVKKQCINDSESLENYLPVEPRLNNEKSKNIYQDHLKKMKHILDIKQDISELEQTVAEHSKQNQAKSDHQEELSKENQRLQDQIDKLSAQ